MKIGDPITYVTGSTVAHGKIDNTDFSDADAEYFWVRTPGSLAPLRHDARGTKWLEGHHEPDSEVARALLASYAIANSAF